jgi:hypothetical protein
VTRLAPYDPLDFSRRQLIGLATAFERDDGQVDTRRQRARDRGCTLPPGLIAIEHQHDAVEMRSEQVGLACRANDQRSPAAAQDQPGAPDGCNAVFAGIGSYLTGKSAACK